MKRNFLRGLLICLIPIALFGAAAIFGTVRQGIDLAGGTILVYEVDLDKTKRRQQTESNDKSNKAKAVVDDDAGLTRFSSEDLQRLAEALKRRIDPVDTRNVIIRPVGESRIEIIVPFTPSRKKEAGTEDYVQFVKDVVSRVGVLEFRILANEIDDVEAVREATELVNGFSDVEADKAAKAGLPPPSPVRREGYNVSVNNVAAENVKYEWIEIGKEERESLGLNIAQAETSNLGRTLAASRGKAVLHQGARGDRAEQSTMLLFSRKFVKEQPAKEEIGKDIEYYVLTRVSDLDQVRIGGDVTMTATADNQSMKWITNFRFNGAGDAKFGAMTGRNRPTTGQYVRHLAILLDDKIVSAPTVNSEIRGGGQISGNFTKDAVDRLVYILRSGALTAELKPNPVSENFVGPTLGRDTITKGLWSVGLSFLAVMAFMVVYYRFAGAVACVALMINLLLTVGFMISVNAAFTLAGLAGIVLMLGMAVDANVLIYERVREEREKGANLLAAIRAGYDRALPTIIDTHVSSIFTAIVLFVFGNDNLKGFAVSLTVGLIISLFTSLFVTRLIFDFWLTKRWMTDFRPMRLFARPNIDFMGIRKQMFALTVFLTVAGLGLFLVRGNDGLNVDFRGGTVYGGRLTEARGLSATGGKPGILDLLAEAKQAEKLKVKDVIAVQDTDSTVKVGALRSENTYKILYEGSVEPVVVTLSNKPAGDTPEEQRESLRVRASSMPDASVEQVIVSSLDADLATGTSKSFTIRTTEKEKELVQVMLDRLLRDENGVPLMETVKLKSTSVDGSSILLEFQQPTSVAYAESLMKRQFRLVGREPMTGRPFLATGIAAPTDSDERKSQIASGKYLQVQFDVSKNSEFKALADTVQNRADGAKVSAVLGGIGIAAADTPQADEDRAALVRIADAFKATFEARPVPERLETFDAALASDTQAKAFYAIVASWVAILLYLWFRFGSWTFGLAAVFCLIHDLCFTLGAIALCHYLHILPVFGTVFQLQDFKIDLATVAALLTLIGYSVNDTIVVFDRIREVRGKNPLLTEKMINDSVNQTLSRTVLASLTVFLVVGVLYWFGGDGVHLFAFVMVVGVIVGTYSSIYIASPLLLFFGEGQPKPELPATPVKKGKAIAAKA